MNQAINTRPLASTQISLNALVRTAVGLFGEQHLEAEAEFFRRLQADEDGGFPALTSSVGERLQWLRREGFGRISLPPALALLAREFQLESSQGFCPQLLCLSIGGELENDYLLNLALARLQGPDASARPALHVIAALLEFICERSCSPLELITWPLIKQGIVQVQGEGPLPLRQLKVEPALWQCLTRLQDHGGGQKFHFPGMSCLAQSDSALIPAAMVAEVDRWAALIRSRALRGVVLRGFEAAGREVACLLAERLGRVPALIEGKMWQQQPLLEVAAHYSQCLPIIRLQLGPAERFQVDGRTPLPCAATPLVFLAGREGSVEIDGLINVELPVMAAAQRQLLWQSCLGDALPGTQLARSALLDGVQIQQVSKIASLEAQRNNEALLGHHIVNARFALGSGQLRQLAQPVSRQVDADALILTKRLRAQFEQLMQRCLEREGLWSGLGHSAGASASCGVRALFTGDSGTGKTLAASHLATRLQAPLYRLDVAAVMNKYVGETEKNLGLLMDEAAASDAILLLDEADALFGKRSDGESTGDRFANMLTNFLLTRIENHSGIVILTSNARERIDSAFTRRLDTIIEFTAPGVEERYAIWQSHLGSRSPGEAICRQLAAYSDLAGGCIRNAVLNAAALDPGGRGEAIRPASLYQTLAGEYQKLGRSLPAPLEQLRRACEAVQE